MTSGGRRAAGLGIIPAAFLVHNVEEAVMIPPMLPTVQATLRGMIGQWVTLPSAGHYVAALVILTLAVFAFWLAALRRDGLAYGLVVFQATMTLNVLNHIGGAVILRGYAPGVVTAVLVEAVTSVVVLWRVRRGGWMSRRQWKWAAIWAVVLHGPLFYGLGLLALRG
jgi:hypothetical protein